MKKNLYRNTKLLEVLRESPFCWGCGKNNDGTVVAAHSNQLRDGKGRGIKAHDFRVAALCHECHSELDQGAELDREERIETWEEAHRRTIAWLFLDGRLQVK